MKKVVVFGSHTMAREYLRVLRVLEADVTVIGRNARKAEVVAQEYGYVGYGNGAQALEKIDPADVHLAILASAPDSLDSLARACFSHGIKNILIEKPGAMTTARLDMLRCNKPKDAAVGVSYNRRFYAATLELKERIAADGGAVGCFFDFTERPMDLMDPQWTDNAASRWGFVNSSHVIDLAFYLVGPPIEFHGMRAGSLARHPAGATFVGHGRTAMCPFSYFASWSGGGRWGVEITTRKGRYKMSPLEELHFCAQNQFGWERLVVDDQDDKSFKPGILKTVQQVLLSGEWKDIPSLEEAVEFSRCINKIFGYAE